VLDTCRRQRRRPPPLSWYLPAAAAQDAESDRVDVVEGLVIEGGIPVEVLTGIALHGGLVAAWPMPAVTAQTALDAMVEHGRTWGRPAFAQVEHDTRLQGPHQQPAAVGRVIRLCLALEVVPVFAPPRETGVQAAIDGCNAPWQAKVWTRFQHDSLGDLQARSTRDVAAHQRSAMARSEAAPRGSRFPSGGGGNSMAPWGGPSNWLRVLQMPLSYCRI